MNGAFGRYDCTRQQENRRRDQHNAAESDVPEFDVLNVISDGRHNRPPPVPASTSYRLHSQYSVRNEQISDETQRLRQGFELSCGRQNFIGPLSPHCQSASGFSDDNMNIPSDDHLRSLPTGDTNIGPASYTPVRIQLPHTSTTHGSVLQMTKIEEQGATDGLVTATQTTDPPIGFRQLREMGYEERKIYDILSKSGRQSIDSVDDFLKLEESHENIDTNRVSTSRDTLKDPQRSQFDTRSGELQHLMGRQSRGSDMLSGADVFTQLITMGYKTEMVDDILSRSGKTTLHSLEDFLKLEDLYGNTDEIATRQNGSNLTQPFGTETISDRDIFSARFGSKELQPSMNSHRIGPEKAVSSPVFNVFSAVAQSRRPLVATSQPPMPSSSYPIRNELIPDEHQRLQQKFNVNGETNNEPALYPPEKSQTQHTSTAHGPALPVTEIEEQGATAGLVTPTETTGSGVITQLNKMGYKNETINDILNRSGQRTLSSLDDFH